MTSTVCFSGVPSAPPPPTYQSSSAALLTSSYRTQVLLLLSTRIMTDVHDDTETFLNKIDPKGRSAPWKHTLEGPDDMPAHIKSSIFGCALTIPITNGKLNMGTWQGLWLCEHRDHPTPRKVVVTLDGR